MTILTQYASIYLFFFVSLNVMVIVLESSVKSGKLEISSRWKEISIFFYFSLTIVKIFTQICLYVFIWRFNEFWSRNMHAFIVFCNTQICGKSAFVCYYCQAIFFAKHNVDIIFHNFAYTYITVSRNGLSNGFYF